MAETKNIYIPRTVSAENTDALVKTGVAEIELRNGDIVAFGTKTSGVYALTAVASDTTKFGIVYNADVVATDGYRGLSDDPRDIVFPAGTTVNFYIPQVGDEIAVTVVAGTASGAKYLVPTTDGTGYTYATTASTKLNYEITEAKFVSVGNTRIATVEATCTVA